MKEKEKIYIGALNIILERGYDNTPLSLIAKELGLSKGGLYHHFITKEQLLYEIIRYQIEKEFLPIIEKAKQIESPKERIAFFFERYLKLLANEPVGFVSVHETRRLTAEHYSEIQKIWRDVFDFISDAISEMQAAGEAKKLNTAFTSFSMIGMCSWLFYWFDYSRKESIQELCDTFFEIFFNGMLEERNPD